MTSCSEYGSPSVSELSPHGWHARRRSPERVPPRSRGPRRAHLRVGARADVDVPIRSRPADAGLHQPAAERGSSRLHAGTRR
jgi:hypothetical protein